MLLVTGITGHTGTYFLNELIKQRYNGLIRCTIRGTSDTSLIKESQLNIEMKTGDLNDDEFIEEIMKDISEVVHIYNIHHSPRIVAEAIKHNVDRVILVHTTGVYSKFKQASQEYIRIENEINSLINRSESTTKVIIARPTMIYGDLCDRNISKFIAMIDKYKLFPVINGGQNRIQPIHAMDLAKGLYTLLVTADGNINSQSYDLSGERPIKLIDALQLMSQGLKKNTRFINIPMPLAVAAAHIIKIGSFNKVDIVEKVKRMGEDRSYSHEQATKDLDFKPMPFELGLKREIEQYLSNR